MIKTSCGDNSAIKINSVSKAFTNRLVLKNISLDITAGQSVYLCGVNGAGKTTLLRIVAGLLPPDQGTVLLHEHDVAKYPEKTKRLLGMISHKSMVYPELTVFENISFFADIYGLKDRKKLAEELLENMGLSPYKYDSAAVLSRGMLQRLSIARALIHKPAVLLADEPFTGLDTEACNHLQIVLNDFTRQGGTILMTSHDTNIALKCCGRVLVLDKAGLIFDDMTDNIDSSAFVKDYISYVRTKK